MLNISLLHRLIYSPQKHGGECSRNNNSCWEIPIGHHCQVVVQCDEQERSPWLLPDEGHADQKRLKVQLSQNVVDGQCHQIHDDWNPQLHQKVL
ncbi:hypothetical protein SLEP1_g30456 [Rubroshorea leprosula]|uniref:Uncharacterized protein n=1 Tax=Rubroshorea leprosula TaxID=152421 RepID=A0AAV5K2I8_9ROSI|nr:hypothetical protein SLEP1_g30456 [Rubroshorea leprosula]